MIKSTLGAFVGGTTRGGHQIFESATLGLSTPPNGTGGAGIWFPLITSVELAEPGVPLICWADADWTANITATAARTISACLNDLLFINLFGFDRPRKGRNSEAPEGCQMF